MSLADPADRASDPPPGCPRCPRLVAFRHEQQTAFPDWHNAPVPTFGDREGRLLVVGLAPGLKGANRTGRPFTGDYAGDLLYQTLARYGFARGSYRADPADGLTLEDAAITNAVRCVPPQNKPLGAEIAACRPYLAATIASMQRLSVILALGRIAHDSVVTALAERPSRWPFRHGALHAVPGRPVLADSYHCSRYNTNTRRLTPAMFEAVFETIAAHLAEQAAA